jgi:predicted phosphodiesterase
MRLVFIGDVHGKMTQLRLELERTVLPMTRVFQLGDMGLGFPDIHLRQYPQNFGFIRGNHDKPAACRNHPNYLGDFGYIQPLKMFFLSGAFSIDALPRISRMRKGGAEEWWHDEELSPEELRRAFNLYAAKQPEIVISHECPSSVGALLLQQLGYSFFSDEGSKSSCLHSRTAKALQWMFEIHKPKYWIFGHYHTDKTMTLDGTTFRCCAELSTYEIEI